MASPKIIQVKESLPELRRLHKKASNLIAPRIRMLIELKKHEEQGISKRELADLIGVNHNSIQTWRTIYVQGGITYLCSHRKKGFRPSVFTKDEHKVIEEKLNDPFNGLRGYKELLNWIEQEFGKDIKYNTLLKYCIRNFGSSVKVARKSHVKKDPQAVEAFKKTSHKSAGRPLNTKGKGLKK
jgi:transposase